MSTDVENSNNNMVLRSDWLRGMVRQSFTDSLLSLPSITLFRFGYASGLNSPDLMDNIVQARKRQTSSNSCPSPDHFDSCSVPVRLHLLK